MVLKRYRWIFILEDIIINRTRYGNEKMLGFIDFVANACLGTTDIKEDLVENWVRGLIKFYTQRPENQ